MPPQLLYKGMVGRPATRTICIFLKDIDKNYFAILANPKINNINNILVTGLVAKANGPNELLGIIKDKGIELSTINEDIPQWASKFIPLHLFAYGCAQIIFYPIKI